MMSAIVAQAKNQPSAAGFFAKRFCLLSFAFCPGVAAPPSFCGDAEVVYSLLSLAAYLAATFCGRAPACQPSFVSVTEQTRTLIS
jgi:hypothetical protein